MPVNLLLKLLTAHLLTDFIFLPASWISDISQKKIRSVKLVWHVLGTALLAYVFSGRYHTWEIPLVILISHYLIDLVKVYLPDKFGYFLAAQAAHTGVIAAIWLIADGQGPALVSRLIEIGGEQHVWLVAFGYILVTWPLGTLIGRATVSWRREIAASAELTDSLASAGKWIGICERILILTFVLTGQFASIGFLIAAKSILRFGEKNAQKKTEYILVGTLMSFSLSALLGIIITYALH